MKKIHVLLLSLIILGGVLIGLFFFGQNTEWFSAFSPQSVKKNLSSSAINTNSSTPLPNISCQKISTYDENGDEVIDFILVSEGKKINSISFFGNPIHQKDISLEYLFSLLKNGGDIAIGQSDAEKTKFAIEYSENSFVYTQSIFFDGAEYRCPSIQLQDEEATDDSCDDLYNQLDFSEIEGITCTGYRSFTVEREVSSTASANAATPDALMVSIGNSVVSSAFAVVPPTTILPRKKNVLKKIGGGICYVVGNTAQTVWVGALCPVKVCQATVNGVNKQLKRIPKIGGLLATATSVAISKTPAGWVFSATDALGVVERVVIKKEDPVAATLDQLLGAQPDNAFIVLKGTRKQICDIWKE